MENSNNNNSNSKNEIQIDSVTSIDKSKLNSFQNDSQNQNYDKHSYYNVAFV